MIRGRNTWPAVVLAAAALVPQARGESPEEIFDRGNTAYEKGSYEEAADAYETVLRYGIRDAKVEYNLGNAAFKLGRLGEAILHYEKALRLDPTDPDIQANLELARSRCFDRVEPEELATPVRLVRTMQDALGPDRQAVAMLVLVWLICGLVALRSAQPRGWNATAGWTLAVLLVIGALTTLSWYATYERTEGSRVAVVLDGTVDVLAGPGENNASLFTVHEGTTLEVRAERQEWVQVSLPNGLHGWVARDSVGFV